VPTGTPMGLAPSHKNYVLKGLFKFLPVNPEFGSDLGTQKHEGADRYVSILGDVTRPCWINTGQLHRAAHCHYFNI